MREALGKQVRYMVLQKRNEQRRFMIYNVYNGSFDFTEDVNSATKFEDPQVAIDLKKIQEMQNHMMNNNFEFEAVKQVIERIVIDEEYLAELEKEVVEAPEAPVESEGDGEVDEKEVVKDNEH